MSSDLTFVDHRVNLDVYEHALGSGLSDCDYVNLVERLDREIENASGVGFSTTPVEVVEVPGRGPVIAKVETANVGGSHKARHLFGLLLRLEIDEQCGKPRPDELAIASCGNAALGAATIANAVGRRLRVFVPDNADPVVVAKLQELDATVQSCPRTPGVSGDPCIEELSRALEQGAEAFTVQGPTCPSVIDGGRTLGLELAQQLRDASLAPSDLYVQVGGGALGAATMDGLERGGIKIRLHVVQPAAAHPFVAMWGRFAQKFDLPNHGGSELTAWVSQFDSVELRQLISRNSGLMEAWPGTPLSIASGILDDITYDWQPLLYHLLRSGGATVLASEDDFVLATNVLQNQITPAPDATGAAGLAGVLADQTQQAGPPLILVTGVDRQRNASEPPRS